MIYKMFASKIYSNNLIRCCIYLIANSTLQAFMSKTTSRVLSNASQVGVPDELGVKTCWLFISRSLIVY